MPFPLGLTIVVCFLISVAIVRAIGGSDGTIARVLGEAEHPEKRR